MNNVEVRLTPNIDKVLDPFIQDPTAAHYGYELITKADLPSGIVYPALGKLTRAGLLERFDAGEGAPSEGPPRVTYRIKPSAVELVRQARAQAKAARGRQRVRKPRLVIATVSLGREGP